MPCSPNNKFSKGSILTIITFIVLFPGLFVCLPAVKAGMIMPMGNNITAYVVHALIFALIMKFLTNKERAFSCGKNLRDWMKTFILPCMIALAIFGFAKHYFLMLSPNPTTILLLKVIFSVIFLNLIEFYDY
ncbi:hypothetical protein CPAV1605_1216 [seawater metagenome]|uniref:Uncharacterized protein n=1 Tax=seawater metagenome TaxID=1561972 RepID=A0A5E8CLY7_9ZZZZ